MKLPLEAERRMADDKVGWLTTVNDRGVPVPNPVWFVRDGDDLVVFTSPGSHRVQNIGQRPTVAVHFNSDFDGGDVVVLTGDVEMSPGQAPSAFPGYLDKYEADITGPLNLTIDELDQTYDTQLRIRPTRVRLT